MYIYNSLIHVGIESEGVRPSTIVPVLEFAVGNHEFNIIIVN